MEVGTILNARRANAPGRAVSGTDLGVLAQRQLRKRCECASKGANRGIDYDVDLRRTQQCFVDEASRDRSQDAGLMARLYARNSNHDAK